jgi:hypothetical protein
MKSSFFDFDERLALINGVIKPGFDALAAESAFRVSSPAIAGRAARQDN